MSYAYRSTRSPYARPKNRRTNTRRRPGAQYIDPARFIKAASDVVVEAYTPQHAFADFEIQQLIKDNLAAKGFQTPTPIQDQTISLALAGQDVIGIANTGTGKTAAFAVPILHQLMSRASARALIVAPTRELAQQIEDEVFSIGKNANLRGALLIGGASITRQLRDLRFQPQIVIGTPGRIKDHLERRSLNLSHFNLVVLDEVDRMLDMGFVRDVRTILQQLAEKRQSLFFSATIDERVRSLISGFASDAVNVSVKTGDTADGVNQDVVKYSDKFSKLEQLNSILNRAEMTKILIFDETQRSVERLNQKLNDRGFKVDSIHGGKSQGQRQRALKRFKAGEINILVATDVAARGIDVADIYCVINYSQPNTYQDYVHRIGRAGRAGKSGQALTFVEG